MVKGCREVFSSVLDPLACWLSKGFLKRIFLNIFLTMSFTAGNQLHKLWSSPAVNVSVKSPKISYITELDILQNAFVHISAVFGTL